MLTNSGSAGLLRGSLLVLPVRDLVPSVLRLTLFPAIVCQDGSGVSVGRDVYPFGDTTNRGEG